MAVARLLQASVFWTDLVSGFWEVRNQSLHLTLEDVVLLHLVLHRRQILAKALPVEGFLKGAHGTRDATTQPDKRAIFADDI